MIAPNQRLAETTAADHLATDVIAATIERIRSAVQTSKARVELKVAATVAEVMRPMEQSLETVEKRIKAYDVQ